jgi:hypothetical protein
MRALCTNTNLHERWSAVRYDLHFVEKHAGRAGMLEVTLREFEKAMRERGPGWSDRVRWTQDLVQQPKSDTLIFLPLSFVNRFKNRPGQETALDRFFGTRDWGDVPDGPQRPAKLLELFENQLRAAGMSWVGHFRLKPDPSNEYYIVGGSGHPKGWASIKEGFWAVDPVHGRQYQAPKPIAPGQQQLDMGELQQPKPDTAPLLELLREQFGMAPFTVEQAMGLTAGSDFLDTRLKVQPDLAQARRTRSRSEHHGVPPGPEGRGPLVESS